MSTAEFFAKSVLLEGKGVHAFTWDDKEDLVHFLLILLASFSKGDLHPLLLKALSRAEKELRHIFEIQPISKDKYDKKPENSSPKRKNVLLLFLDQAVSNSIGPLLNGWRSALAEPPGTIIGIRSADLIGFQRNAPDLASFIGPKVFDSTMMLSLWNAKTSEKINLQLPENFSNILKKLPGKYPSEDELFEWLEAHPSTF